MINPPKPGDESFPKFDKVVLICYCSLLEAYKNIWHIIAGTFRHFDIIKKEGRKNFRKA